MGEGSTFKNVEGAYRKPLWFGGGLKNGILSAERLEKSGNEGRGDEFDPWRGEGSVTLRKKKGTVWVDGEKLCNAGRERRGRGR